MPMKAEIISVGTELLLGEIADTNSTYLATQLPVVGIDLLWVTVVGDELDHLAEAFRRAMGRSDVVLATGGLGPTQDDLTREAIAHVLGEEPVIVEPLEKEVRAFFDRLGRAMPEQNLKQAMLVPSAQTIPNPRGTAPGWWVEKDGTVVVAMPGPPGEMQPMWLNEVYPRLRSFLQGSVIISRTLKSFGLSEAGVDEMVRPLCSWSNPSLGTYAKPDGIHLRVLARCGTAEEAQGLLAGAEAEIRRVLGDYIWGVDDDTLEGVVGRLLADRGLKLATMESCTGGLLAAALTETPGSSDYYVGGFVTYSNEAKVAAGVDAGLIERHGAVSPEVAEAMAEAARMRLGADLGIATTGVAGPDEMEGKPAGLVHIGIADGNGTMCATGQYPMGRSRVRSFATIQALSLLRQRLAST